MVIVYPGPVKQHRNKKKLNVRLLIPFSHPSRKSNQITLLDKILKKEGAKSPFFFYTPQEHRRHTTLPKLLFFPFRQRSLQQKQTL